MPEQSSADQIQVPIQFDPDEDALFALAHNLWISHDADHFYLRFYQVVPPMIADKDHMPSAIRGKLLASVALPASVMPSVIRALTENARRYEASMGVNLVWDGEPES